MKTVNDFPAAINLPKQTRIPVGASINPISFEVFTESVPMALIAYHSPHAIDGLWDYERARLLPDKTDPDILHFFVGYRCSECEKVFLVPDLVTDLISLHDAMRHECME